MKRVFELEELDCAHCAMKMEDAIRKIEGVNSVSINFLSQKMAIKAEESSFGAICKSISVPPYSYDTFAPSNTMK